MRKPMFYDEETDAFCLVLKDKNQLKKSGIDTDSQTLMTA